MNYLVIAIKWDDSAKAQVKYVAGEFSDWVNASIFKKAYDEHYSTNCEILKR